ncbi:MAG TPA: glycosyltransferase, partial [Chitinophagaceae bacterium]|nr:glycosyltransferase [Chitinophagaceae bacterium]
MSTKKPKVLVMADWFEPGYKAGGPIRSVVNFAGNLHKDLEIFILTADRDLGDQQAYPGIQPDIWVPNYNDVKVFYASPSWLSWKAVQQTIRSINPDFIYLNSMYSRYFSLYPLLMKRLGTIPGRIILAPRGMLKQSAVAFKSRKKKLFLKLFRTLGLQRNVHFHCTDAIEQRDVQQYFGNVASTVLSNNPGTQKAFQMPPLKNTGSAKLIFVGRMHPIKNLHYLLELLKGVKQNVTLTVIAGLENPAYNEQCRQLAADLPGNITVDFQGELAHHELEQQL